MVIDVFGRRHKNDSKCFKNVVHGLHGDWAVGCWIFHQHFVGGGKAWLAVRTTLRHQGGGAALLSAVRLKKLTKPGGKDPWKNP